MDKRVGRRIEISLIGVAGQDSWASALDARFWSACRSVLGQQAESEMRQAYIANVAWIGSRSLLFKLEQLSSRWRGMSGLPA